ncbi:MAG: YHYH protein [Bacteroidota bacterium]
MRKISISTFLILMVSLATAQTNPVIINWLRNTTGITGRHYVSGNPTPITDAVLANVQTVQYSANWSYVTTNGIPAYITGPFLDGNPSLATSQAGAIFKFPLNPTQNTGTLTATTGGNIGLFKNGVALFDYRDGVSYKLSTGANAGGPLGGTGDGVWNRDAIVAERGGFDCSKAHPAMGNYHHHQNPSAFNLDLTVISTVCNTYPSDGLYVISPTEHSPLLGFAYDGFPIYGAYGYANADGSGGIVRMKSSYQLRNITVRTHYADGTNVTDGPAVNTTYPLGMYREDYEYVAHPTDASYLDVHNGRVCVTPEYPSGIYCYFATVDVNHNSAYPYVVGPTFYGNKTAIKVIGGITETTTLYNPSLSNAAYEMATFSVVIAPNPAQDFIAIQTQMAEQDLNVALIDELGKVIKTSTISQGSTLAIIETDTIYNGIYFVRISDGKSAKSYKVIIDK